MFAKRSDGYAIKVDPYAKSAAHIMSKRSDALNYAKVKIRCEAIDAFIKEMKETANVYFTYLDIMIAVIVRLMSMRKGLNRFVNVGRVFQREYVDISFVIKKALKDDAVATAVKVQFNGSESIYEIKEAVEKLIEANSGTPLGNTVDKTAAIISAAPNIIVRMIWWTLKKLDRWNMLPKSIIKTSPFHTSCFITNMKSIKADYIYHHCYDFGTTGIFIGMGKEQMEPVVENDSVVAAKVLTLGVVTDERFCDGLYFANSTRVMQKLFTDLKLLLEPYHDEKIDAFIERENKKKAKKAKNS
ncbi:MAG: 2-oxoglutarate dehydrogenase [Clostridia bacterium]